MHSQTLFLPDTMATWPWKRTVNPLYEGVKADADAWFESFNVFTPKSMAAFKKCAFPLLASLAYPKASREHLRTGCDLMNVFFVIDEYTDVEPAPIVREIVDIVIDALRNPQKPRPEGELALGEVARQFWERGSKIATPTAQKHMLESFISYLDAVVQQAIDRDENTIPTIESYMKSRRENIGTGPSFAILELGLDLVDDVFYHPTIVELSTYITDLVLLDNDLVSYNKEQAVGDDQNNIVTIVMHQYNFNVDNAMKWVAAYHAQIRHDFLKAFKRIPSWGPKLDVHVKYYLEGLANWPRANICWSFEGGRYFGSYGHEVATTRLLPLYPKFLNCKEDPALRREKVIVPHIDHIREVAWWKHRYIYSIVIVVSLLVCFIWYFWIH